MINAKAPPIIIGMIQMVGYKQERQKKGTKRKELLNKMYHELRMQKEDEQRLTSSRPGTGTLQ
jgi:hypothetical protein